MKKIFAKTNLILATILLSGSVVAQAWFPASIVIGGAVNASKNYNSKLVIAGAFTSAGGNTYNKIESYDGSNWSGLGAGITGAAGAAVYALEKYNSELYAGGSFTNAGGTAILNLAKWNGVSWTNVGGFSSVAGNQIRAFAVDSVNNILYVGGGFNSLTGSPGTSIAKWNGVSWSAVGTSTGTSTNGSILALAYYAGSIYAAGQFSVIGGVLANNIAKWNGTTWTALGTGITNPSNCIVKSLKVYNGELYVGGYFVNAGGLTCNHIAKYNGSSWSTLGSGLSSVAPETRAMEVFGGQLFVGGAFTTAGGVSALNVARWTGVSWLAASIGIGGGYPQTLTGYNGILYTGGGFNLADTYGASNFAKWCSAPSMPSTIAGSTSGCINSNYNYSVTNVSGTTYSWGVTGPGIISGTNNIASATWSVAGTFSVIVTPTNTCYFGPAQTNTVLIYPPPTISATTSSSIICGPPYQGTATLTGGGGSTYTWIPGGTGTSISVTPSITTTYTVTGTDINGCTNSSIITQSVSICSEINQKPEVANEIIAYPNPCLNLIYLKTAIVLSENSEIEISNSLGQTVLKLPYSTTIDVSKLPEGFYYLKINSQNRPSYSSKFIKQ